MIRKDAYKLTDGSKVYDIRVSSYEGIILRIPCNTEQDADRLARDIEQSINKNSVVIARITY